MNGDFQDRVRRFLSFVNIKNNKDLLTFSFFLLLSTVSWFLIVLNKTYTTDIPYPIAYKNFPKGKILTNNPPEELVITIRGKGFDLLKYELTKFLFPHMIDVKKLAKNQWSDKLVFYTQDLMPELTTKFKNDIKIINISPTKIYFEFSPIVTKKVKIVPNIKYQLAKQFVIEKGISIVPDSAIIKGPQTLLDSIQYVTTEFFNFRTINKVIIRKLPIKKIDKVFCTPRYVKIKIPAYKFTETKISVPVEIINAPDTLQFKIVPAKVTVKYKVLLKNFKKVSKKNFKAVVDYSSIEPDVNNKAKVFLSKSSRYAFHISIYPSKVKIFVVE